MSLSLLLLSALTVPEERDRFTLDEPPVPEGGGEPPPPATVIDPDLVDVTVEVEIPESPAVFINAGGTRRESFVSEEVLRDSEGKPLEELVAALGPVVSQRLVVKVARGMKPDGKIGLPGIGIVPCKVVELSKP